MRTHKNLYSEIVSFQNLLLASKFAQRGKRFKDSTAKFNFQLEKELWRLQAELAEKRYEPGKLRNFTIYEPKQRVISAAPYRDRVVHHAINNILEPIFEPVFIYDSYATRKGKGTHAAIDRFQKFARTNKYVLKCDIKRYFPSIDHDVLMELVRRKIACNRRGCFLAGRGGRSNVSCVVVLGTTTIRTTSARPIATTTNPTIVTTTSGFAV